MHSMTGFGRGVAEQDGSTAVVEVAAVNSRKQSDIRIIMPRELAALEPVLRQRVQERVNRGTLAVTVQYTVAPERRAAALSVDLRLGAEAARRLRELAVAAGLEPRLTLADLLAVPGVIGDSTESPAELVRDLAVEALEEALDGLRSMQRAEGGKLREDLDNRVAALRDQVEAMAARTDEALLLQRQRLHDRIALLGVDLPLDDERLAREVAFYAEKSDITEEIVRLRCHLDRFGDLLAEDRDVGRELEFLCQEINREATTIGNKTSETGIAAIGISMKADLARLREQVMNIE
ncbi:MAG: YicC family protein [Lentisphaerae bacterium]|nr:YicC family protein [Lentisphaerota bacterium]